MISFIALANGLVIFHVALTTTAANHIAWLYAAITILVTGFIAGAVLVHNAFHLKAAD